MSRTLYRIPLARPAYFGREEEYVADAVHRRELSMGEYVERFEAACAGYLKVKHAVAVANGTVGLHLAGIVAGWEAPMRISSSPLTYVATANAIRYTGCWPDFTEVDEETWCVSRYLPYERLHVDLYGMALPTVTSYPNAVYDACEAFGATIDGNPMTVRGGLHVFSFYANKILTTGEGGLITTDDDDQARQLRLLRGQGQHATRRYYHEVVGYNARMTNLQGALGLAQVETVAEHLDRRYRRLDQYMERLSSAVVWPVPPVGVIVAPWVFACTIPATIPRDRVMQALANHGIESRPVFPCLHQMPAHRTGESFPVAEDLSRRGIVLPLFAEMTEGQVDEVCDVVIQECRR